MEDSKRAPSGKSRTQPRDRTYVETEDLQSALERIRQVACRDKELRFTSLWHHVTNIDRLRQAYFGLKRNAAPGVDGLTWQQYGESLEENLQDTERASRRTSRIYPQGSNAERTEPSRFGGPIYRRPMGGSVRSE